jgi:hypothetical protein
MALWRKIIYCVRYVAVTVKVVWCDAVCSNTKARIYQVTCIAEDSNLQIINSLSIFMRQTLSDNVLENISGMRTEFWKILFVLLLKVEFLLFLCPL